MTAGAAPRPRAFASILAPLDTSVIAAEVFEAAIALVRGFGGRLHLLRVVTVDAQLPAAGHVVPDGLEDKLLADARAELHALMSSAPGVSFGVSRAVIGDPRRSILDQARDLAADLIVIGSHRYHGMDRLLGTVAANVVNHATCDVMVVHPRPGRIPPPTP